MFQFFKKPVITNHQMEDILISYQILGFLIDKVLGLRLGAMIFATVVVAGKWIPNSMLECK